MTMDDAPRPTVSLIVPVRNEGRFIGACLDAIRAQTYPAQDIEVIVVDGDSSDDTRPIVEAHRAKDRRVVLLSNPQRAMPYGLNIGIRAARGRYVGVVSGHSALPPRYVERAVSALEETGAWAVGARIVRVGSSPWQRAIGVATSSPIGVGDSTHNYAEEPGWVEGAFPGFWRRETFDVVGLFDPRMVVNEDNELSYRIRKAGGRIWYEPAIEVAYHPRDSLGGLFHQYRRYALGKMRVLRKHRGGLRWRHAVPAAWVAFVVVGAIGAPWSPVVALLWGGGLVIYLAVILVASARAASREVGWWRIAAAFITLHAGYGIGTWQGLLTWRAR